MAKTHVCMEPAARTSVHLPRIYVSSRVRHAHLWLAARRHGHRICASWIDEAKPGQTADLGELWHRITGEIQCADAFMIYRHTPDEILKGAYVELGMAMMRDIPVFAIGFDLEQIPNFMQRPIASRQDHRRAIIQHYRSISAALVDVAPRCARWRHAVTATVCRSLQGA